MNNEQNRQTGRTTARRLMALAYACMAPGSEVEFRDHEPHTLYSARRNYDILRNYVELLELRAEVSLRGTVVVVKSLLPADNSN